MFPKIVILRFNRAFHEDHSNCYQSAAAICNALQEPGFATNTSISLFGASRSESLSDQSSPKNRTYNQISIVHVLTVAVKAGWLPGNPMADIPLLYPPNSKPAASNDGRIEIQPNEGIFINLKGISSEVDEFRSLSPEYFFINCQLLWIDLDGDGSLHRKPIIVPVFRKNQFYYLCSGERESKVYKVQDPLMLFFSHEGHLLLELNLSAAYCGSRYCARVDLRGDGHAHEMNSISNGHNDVLLSIPKLVYRGPSNWDSQS